MTKQEKAVLARAERLVRRGWCQKSYAWGPGGATHWSKGGATKVCLAGAVYRAAWMELGKPDRLAASLDDLAAKACGRLGEVLERRGQRTDIISFNDAEEREKSEVLELLVSAQGPLPRKRAKELIAA